MIPRIAKGGHSFKGAYQYFLHDKGQTTKERVLWTQTENMLTEDPDLAWKVMAYTALEQNRLKEASDQKATGRKLQKPVFSYSLAWHPEQDPDKEHMLETARKSLAALGMSDHETLIVAHRDEPHRHVHIIVNRVHPLTGLAANLSNTKQKLSDFAYAYEEDTGKIYCQQRQENAQKRKEGQKTRYADQNILEAWQEAVDGKSFAAALKKRGYALAQGNKRIVVVDPHGKIHNPTRHLQDVRAKDIKEKLKDLNLSSLFDAASLSQQLRQQQKQEYKNRQKQSRDAKEEFSPAAKPPSSLLPAILNQMQDRQIEERAKLFNRHYDEYSKEHQELTDFYKIDEQKQKIEELSEKTANPSWWRRLFGFHRKDSQRLVEMQHTLDDAFELMNQRLRVLELERENDLRKLAERHAEERARLNRSATEKSESTERTRPRIPPPRSRKKDRGFDFEP